MRARHNTNPSEMRLGERTLAVLEEGQKHENKFTAKAREIFNTPPYHLRGISHGSTHKEKSGKEQILDS